MLYLLNISNLYTGILPYIYIENCKMPFTYKMDKNKILLSTLLRSIFNVLRVTRDYFGLITTPCNLVSAVYT